MWHFRLQSYERLKKKNILPDKISTWRLLQLRRRWQQWKFHQIYCFAEKRVLRGQRGWVSSRLCQGPEPQPTKWQCREVKISTILNLNKFSSGWSSWWRTGSERFTRKIDCKMFSWVLRRWGRGALAWSPLTSTVKSWELLSGESWRWGDVVWDMVGEWRSCAERP